MSDDEDDTNDEKLNFEQERDKILKDLPQSLKDKFGTIGFCIVEDDEDEGDDDGDEDDKKESSKVYYQPVLIVSPFDVPPKPVRDVYWMDAFMKAKKSKGKLAGLDYLVYVYGSDDLDDCYNFVSHDEFITFEEGQANGYDEIQSDLQTKMDDATATLTEVEQKLVRGIQEMKQDLEKVPADRKPHGGKHPFLERYQVQQTKQPPAKKQKT